MPNVTEHYQITEPVPFADVNVSADNLLFLDPHAVRLSAAPEPFVADAIRCMDTFLTEIVRCITVGTPTDKLRGEGLLQHFKEPWETRLGMSSRGYHGHGGAEDVGTAIWRSLNDDLLALVQVGVLRHLEELPMFVTGVDRDITSDLTTRLLFEPLGRFTEAMLRTYPQFKEGGHVSQGVSRQVWNADTADWAEATFELPVADGRPLLLVPAHWARRHLLMSATRYYEKTILDFAQIERAVIGSDGKLIRTPKDVLQKQAGLGRGRSTNVRLTLQAFERDENLIDYFKAFVASRYERPNDEGSAA
jgi:hypothetical protein